MLSGKPMRGEPAIKIGQEMTVDRAADAKRFRRQAEQLRAISEGMSDQGTRTAYLERAEAYEKLADNEERAVNNLKN
jgi:hypothetical protein